MSKTTFTTETVQQSGMHHHIACPVRDCSYSPDVWNDQRRAVEPTCTCLPLNRRLMARLLKVDEGSVHEQGCWERAALVWRGERR